MSRRSPSSRRSAVSVRFSGVKWAALILASLLAVGGATQAVVNVSLAQLRIFIAREQLLNYELSSRMLHIKFKRMLLQDEDIDTEVRMKVLESSVLNFEQASGLRLAPDERIGLWIVNGVRFLNLKPVIRLVEDQDRLLLLQYAFHLERQRDYAGAAAHYAKLDGEFGPEDENRAFTLLHRGFCLALKGEPGPALDILRVVEADFPGTHYQTNARVLINILREGERSKAAILREFRREVERARAFYRAGRYSAAVKSFDRAQRLTRNDRFLRARSMEEIGELQRAIAEYKALAAAEDRVAVRSNRRLIVIGEVYDGGEAVQRFARNKARELGDAETLSRVQQVAVLKEKPRVHDNIKRRLARDPSAFDAGTVERLQKIQADLERKFKAEEAAVALVLQEEEERKKKAEAAAERAAGSPLELRVELADDRSIPGRFLSGAEDALRIQSQLPFRIAPGDLRRILPVGTGDGQTLAVLTKSGAVFYAPRIEAETEAGYLSFAGRRLRTKRIRSVSPVLSAGPERSLRVVLRDGVLTHGRSIVVENETRLALVSRVHRQDFSADRVARIELYPGAGGAMLLGFRDGTRRQVLRIEFSSNGWKLDGEGAVRSQGDIRSVRLSP